MKSFLSTLYWKDILVKHSLACISFSNITYGPFFFVQGTTADQDNRFSDKKKKLMKSMKFNDGLEKKVSYKLCLFIW